MSEVRRPIRCRVFGHKFVLNGVRIDIVIGNVGRFLACERCATPWSQR